jgi:hypothetical protein
MPLQKLLFKPGVDRENTRYTSEGGWYECDKIRFRQGTPEKIGGWNQYSTNQFLGTCRSIIEWVTLDNNQIIGLGTNLKYYVERGSAYNDITPIRATTAAGDVTFAATAGSSTITVTDVAHGAIANDFVTFSGAVSLGGNINADVLNQEYQIVSIVDDDNYTITAKDTAGTTVVADGSDTGNGGASVVGTYQINTGPAYEETLSGWGAGYWGYGTWGFGTPSIDALRIWNHSNFGEDLVFGPRGGALYYYDYSSGVATRGVNISTLTGASDTPVVQNNFLVSDVSRFVLCFGVNPLGSSTIDPMLVRWSDQESVANWTPSATNQAGDLRLSIGSKIVTAKQQRQEILVWTDSALYSMQYLGPPYVWGAQSLGENISIMGPNAVATASNMTFWMGKDKFYMYDGRVRTLPCNLRQFIFQNSDPNLNINLDQSDQVFACTVEAFNEVWWFYCSSAQVAPTSPDRYVVFNYADQIWYYGSLSRTAWLDSKIKGNPIAAYSDLLLNQETGVDDNSTGTPAAIEAYITSTEVDIGDGHNFAFIYRILPDVTFRGSTAGSPTATITLQPMQNSGSGYNSPASVAGSASASVTRSAVIPIEQFTGQVYTRVRGRQVSFKIASDSLGTTWQLGAPRIDIRPDGRR